MYIADLHIHSKYSRATSRDCTPEHLDLWARRKGIGLLGTGDFTHPAWREELKQKLQPAEEGLYVLREEFRLEDPTAGGEHPRFVLSGEISSIYKKNGRVRKVHNVILLPGLAQAEELSRRLEAIGNIHSDGRPILGLDSRDLLEITLEACPDAIFIPAHIWTPHFSLFGAFSGFDTIEECFEDLTPHIHALETGLSSDPPMIWRLSALDRFTLVSNSDAHSPAKLGREANLIEGELSYPGLSRAIQGGRDGGFAGTIEFFPEEGKYHFDGHRNCGLCLPPSETVKYGGKCPVCGKKITIGVQHRVEQLADRAEGFIPAGTARFESLVPLPEVIGASTGRSGTGVRVQRQYEQMLGELGPEFSILREVPVSDIERVAGPCVAEGIRRLREGKVERTPGFDGEYGKIKLLDPAEIEALNGQICLLGFEKAVPKKKRASKKLEPSVESKQPKEESAQGPLLPSGPLDSLNEEQRAAVMAEDPVVAVIAGPGTGKTKTLVSRIAYLVESRGVDPAEITAVTFTNKAAGEMRQRLQAALGSRAAKLTIGTFHSICLNLLTESGGEVRLADEEETLALAEEVLQQRGLKLSPRAFVQEVSKRKNGLPDSLDDGAYEEYCARLDQELGAADFDDLLLRALARWEQGEESPQDRRFSHLLVDEFQDINGIQHRLVRAWSEQGKNLFVIGDPDQSIYGFRGSDARCFDRLREERGGLREIKLVRNYRSTPDILRCALPVIGNNPGPNRVLEAQREPGGPVELITAESDLSEGIFIAKEINRMVGGIDMLDAQNRLPGESRTRDFSDIALLYRTHRQAAVLEKCLRTEGIPYVVSGREDFLQDSGVRGTVGFFRFLLDPADSFSLRSCLRLIWNCPNERCEQICTFWEELNEEGFPQRIDRLVSGVGSTDCLAEWAQLAQQFLPIVSTNSPAELIDQWAVTVGLKESDPVKRLANMAAFHPDMPSFVQALLLGQEADLMRSSGKDYASGAVSLMTMHGAKGLEFPVVFLCGVRKGCIPHEAAGNNADTEEERRLFYVGMTRAKEELLLLTSKDPSLFLEEIPAESVQRRAARKHSSPTGVQMSLF